MDSKAVLVMDAGVCESSALYISHDTVTNN